MDGDYRMVIDVLVDDIEAFAEELAEMRSAAPRHETPSPIPFPPTAKQAPEPTATPAKPPLSTHFVLPPPATWATVAKMGGKQNYDHSVKSAQATTKRLSSKCATKMA